MLEVPGRRLRGDTTALRHLHQNGGNNLCSASPSTEHRSPTPSSPAFNNHELYSLHHPIISPHPLSPAPLVPRIRVPTACIRVSSPPWLTRFSHSSCPTLLEVTTLCFLEDWPWRPIWSRSSASWNKSFTKSKVCNFPWIVQLFLHLRWLSGF